MARSVAPRRCAALLLCVTVVHVVAGEGASRVLLQSTCEKEGGSCKDVKQCQSPVAGICPGPANVQCCFNGAGAACTSPSGPGTCRVEGRQSCDGDFFTGLCPGPTKVKCCVKPGSGVGGSGGGSGGGGGVGGSGGGNSNSGSNTDLVPIPANINPRYSSGKRETLRGALGAPCSNPTEECQDNFAAQTSRNFQSANVGPFSVTGLRPAVQALQRIFSRVKAEKPGLYNDLKSLGMACCRYTRGSTQFSNHSWGSAIDIGIGATQADLNKDGRTYRGLADLYPYFEAEGFYWGAGFSTNEDPVHFEVSEQKLQEWISAGLIS